MSAYGHEVETEYSASLSSGEESDMGSEFRLESVIYMSSFAATIFIGALVTIGVLLIIVLISLVVMLQSCQSRNSGDIELLNHYAYCRTSYLHAELNNFESYSLPGICKDVAVKYIRDGHYMRDLSTTVSLIEDSFRNVTPVVGDRAVVVIDIDDLVSSDSFSTNSWFHRFRHYGHDHAVKEVKHLKHLLLVQVYKKLWYRGWSLVLLSREHEKQRGTVIDMLIASGCGGWSELIMRSDEEIKIDTREYFFKQKAVIQEKGYNIKAVISSRIDILVGPFMSTQNFKLPNPYITPEVER